MVPPFYHCLFCSCLFLFWGTFMSSPRARPSHNIQKSSSPQPHSLTTAQRSWRAASQVTCNPAGLVTKRGGGPGRVADPLVAEPSPRPPELTPLVRPKIDRCVCFGHQGGSPKVQGIRRPDAASRRSPSPSCLGVGLHSAQAIARLLTCWPVSPQHALLQARPVKAPAHGAIGKHSPSTYKI